MQPQRPNTFGAADQWGLDGQQMRVQQNQQQQQRLYLLQQQQQQQQFVMQRRQNYQQQRPMPPSQQLQQTPGAANFAGTGRNAMTGQGLPRSSFGISAKPSMSQKYKPQAPSAAARASNYAMGPEVLNDSSSLLNSVPLFVGNLNTMTTDQDLASAFAPFGTVLYVRIMRNRRHVPLGYAFVTLATKEAADAAVQALNKATLRDRVLRVRIASTGSDADCASVTDLGANVGAGQGDKGVNFSLSKGSSEEDIFGPTSNDEGALAADEDSVLADTLAAANKNPHTLIIHFHYLNPEPDSRFARSSVINNSEKESTAEATAEISSSSSLDLEVDAIAAARIPAHCRVTIAELRRIFDVFGAVSPAPLETVLIRRARQAEHWIVGSGCLSFANREYCSAVYRLMKSVEHDNVHYLLLKSHQMLQFEERGGNNSVNGSLVANLQVPENVTSIPVALNRCLCSELGGRCTIENEGTATESLVETIADVPFSRSSSSYFKPHLVPSYEGFQGREWSIELGERGGGVDLRFCSNPPIFPTATTYYPASSSN